MAASTKSRCSSGPAAMSRRPAAESFGSKAYHRRPAAAMPPAPRSRSLRLRAGLAAEQKHSLNPDERDELQERDSSVRADLDLFQLVDLLVMTRTMKPLR